MGAVILMLLDWAAFASNEDRYDTATITIVGYIPFPELQMSGKRR